MKRKLLFLTALVVSALGMRAQWTDVTSTYISNPSFELGTDGTPKSTGKSFVAPYQWTPTDMPSSGTHNFAIFTENETTSTSPSSFGTTVKPSDGTYYYFARHSWSTTLTTVLTQTSQTALPTGYYYLTIDYKIAKSNGDLNPKGYLTLSAKNGTTTLGSLNSATSASQNGTYFNTAAWTTLRVPFYVSSAGSVDFVITFNFNPQAANIPQEAIIIDNVRLLKADYHATPIATGTSDLYLYNEKEAQYLSAGKNWGTQAICDNYGQELTATLSDGLYSFKTQQYNKNLGPDFYVDNGTAAKLLLLETANGSGKYYITQDGVNYLTSNGAGEALLTNVTTPTDASVWTIVSKSDRKDALTSATIDNPGNATFLIADANFNRNAINSVWNGTSKTSDNKTNLNLAGGNNDNMCAESFHATFSVSQTLSGLHAGVYGLTAQGFYRQDGSDNDHLPYFYLGTEKATFPIKTGSENSMGNASTSFSAGLYTIDPIYVRVEAGGSIDLGAKLENENYSLWCIWDNFQLKYYGDVSVASVKMKAFVDAYNAALSTAQGFTATSMFADAWSDLQDAINNNTLDLNDPGLTENALTTATANLVAANTTATAAVTAKTTYDTAVSTINGGKNVDLTNLIVNPGFETGDTNGWTNSGKLTANAQGNKAFDNTQGDFYAERWHASGTVDINQTIQVLPAGIYQISAYVFSEPSDGKLYANSTEVSASASGKYSVVVEIADKGSIKIGAACTLTNSTWFCVDDFSLTYLGTIDDLTYTLATGKMGTDKSTAQTNAEATFLNEKNLANYNALLAAIAEAEASKANYDKLKVAIDICEGEKDGTNFVTSAATTTFENAIAEAKAAWENVTYTDQEASDAPGYLKWCVGNYLGSTWITPDPKPEGWWYFNTWSTEGDTDGTDFFNPFFENFVGNTNNLPANTFTATLSGLDNGAYEIEIWARVQRRTDANFNNDNSMITMNVNGGEAVSLMSGQTTVGSGNSVMRLGRYKAYGDVTDGTLTLTIDVKLGSNVHWLSWRDVKYTKVDKANMTVKANKWGTFIAPFDVTIPADVEAYTVTGVTTAGYMEKTAVETTIPANTPVVLKNTTDAQINEKYYGKSTATENSYKVGALTGTYTAETIPVGSYVLQTQNNVQAFYKVDAAFTSTPNRCYLTVPSSVKAIFFDDEATGINGVEEIQNLDNAVIYNATGARQNGLQKGVNIIRTIDGKVRKVFVK